MAFIGDPNRLINIIPKDLFEEDPSNERAMRDRMNGIRRDKNGKVTHRHNKPVPDWDDDKGEWKTEIKEEKLEELSPKTLGNYIKKAKSSVGMRMYSAGIYDSEGRYKKGEEHSKKASKRAKGVDKATDKLTNKAIEGSMEKRDYYGTIKEEYDNDLDYHGQKHFEHLRAIGDATKKSHHYDTAAYLHKDDDEQKNNFKELAKKYDELAKLHSKFSHYHRDEHNKLEKDKRFHL